MQVNEGKITLSATDLVAHAACDHLTVLDWQQQTGQRAKPDYYDPLAEILRERGFRHESAFIQALTDHGLSVVPIDGVGITDEVVQTTREAMEAGAEVIVQAALRDGVWSGRADVLLRVDIPSALGDYSYRIVDTKLSRETKGATILQLCLYADLLASMQGTEPDQVGVVVPWSGYEPQWFRVADYGAYYRRVKRAAEQAAGTADEACTYPDPKPHCDMCRWQRECDDRRRADDHLSLVAGITKGQINEWRKQGVDTVEALAQVPVPLGFRPERGSVQALEKTRHQAAIQLKSRQSGLPEYELLEPEPGFGLTALPKPSKGDIFFDIESDAFVGEHGLEYLFGYAYQDEQGAWHYQSHWALDREEEKAAFEAFIDFVTERKNTYPDLHVYHFAPYEPAALKRLMGRYATRVLELDNLLRDEVFVDLLSVTRHALRAGVESYSIKKLEPFFDFERQVAMPEANSALTRLSFALELDDLGAIDDDTRKTVQQYNADDCFATAGLRDWLERLRQDLIHSGKDVPRPEPPEPREREDQSEAERHIQELIAQLTHDVPADPAERTPEQQARWILAHSLEWHRREDKANWWEYFRLCDLSADELIHEKSAIGDMTFMETVGRSKTGIPLDQYAFESQDTDLRAGDTLKTLGGAKIGKAAEVDTSHQTITIQKMRDTAGEHPTCVFKFDRVDTKVLSDSVLALGEYVAAHGIEGAGPYQSARALLLREPPDNGGQELRHPNETPLDAALRIAPAMDGGVLPIQGPPGTGKSYTGARMICERVRHGRKVGVTANSHKVIRNLLDSVAEAAEEMGVELQMGQKPDKGDKDEPHHIRYFDKADKLLDALSSGDVQVAGGTQFFWANPAARDAVDTLVIDEAGQLSLANALAVGYAAPNMVMLGDPQQLEQPSQGSHPDGVDVSALEHLLGEEATIPSHRGLFLDKTWRLHPDICAFNSELFYDGKLNAVDGCSQQAIHSDATIKGSGLRYLPIEHSGNTSAATEEAKAIAQLFDQLMCSHTSWTNRKGSQAELTLDDILIIAPYNAQVFEIQKRLPEGARVGTVDKFQGQEAPVVIYSLTTSSHLDAPRGMDFLYSANRLNVAVSRAKALAILVGAPAIFEAECRTPHQMQLANAFCFYQEVSSTL
ncbi:TM0106 family RecB-like putative nuclease [Thioalkalivibrio sp. ALE14]|uniref:TM0106 family RecB-like putative nuclease n=1 Tax=Thioalkalivibrio sp. ALE14 TaxID=1158168 RepID=UPI00037A7F4D|nr:TM0106 family RecB-like putative nuclease [Thioalkalivibrio sp. ALE14]